MLEPVKDLQEILNRSAELAARLKLAEEHAQRLQDENQKLKALQPENQRLSDRVVLLEEEVRWFKEQFFGRSSQKSGAEISAELIARSAKRGGGRLLRAFGRRRTDAPRYAEMGPAKRVRGSEVAL